MPKYKINNLPDPFEHNIKLLKEQMPNYLEHHLADRIIQRSESSYSLRCPLHGEDNNPSCSVDNSSETWLFFCHACGASGSLLDLHAKINDLEPLSAENLDSLTRTLNLSFEDVKDSNHSKQLTSSEAVITSQKKDLDSEVENNTTENLNFIIDKISPYFTDSQQWRTNLIEKSPYSLKSETLSHKHAFIRYLFEENAILWMGNPKESGQQQYSNNFKARSKWMLEDKLPDRIAAGTFQPHQISRSKKCIDKQPFIVIESDNIIGSTPQDSEFKILNKCFTEALFCLIQQEWGLKLRAVIDTGNKSLHGWFDHPGEEELKAIKLMAPAFCIDEQVLNLGSSLPLRLPGCIHEKTGTPAELLHLNPIKQWL